MSQTHESFGKYILLERLAMGGMAEIYLARSRAAAGVSKFFAIKRILPQYSEQSEFIDMFKDEAKIAVNLSHANIVSIYEFGMEKHQFFLAMDYVEGRNLRQILNKMKKSGVAFSIEQVTYIIKEVAAGLDAAHRCIDSQTGKPLNIIHRDMSPQNVMVSFEGEVKVVDFGIAKAETQIETTRAGTLKGKFGYMSPEQAEALQIDLRTDIFALGIVFWELLANDRLFVANNEINTLRKIRDCQIPSLRKINPNIPQELERIVSKALAKDRNLRYQTAAAFQRDLSKFLNRQFPDFSPHDFSVFIKTLFAGEILESRKKMIEYARIDTSMQPALSAAPSQLPPAAQPSSAPPARNRQGSIDPTLITQTSSVTENTGTGSGDVQDLNSADAQEEQHRRDLREARESRDAREVEAREARPKPTLTPPRSPPQSPASGPAATSSANSRAQAKEKDNEIPSSELSVDRTVFRDRSSLRGQSITGVTGVTGLTSAYTNGGGTRVNYSRTNLKKPAFAVPLSRILIAAVVIFGGAIYFYLNPGRFTELGQKAAEFGKNWGIARDMASQHPHLSHIDQASTNKIDIPISSQPPGAEIMVNDITAPDVTPTTLQIEEGKNVKITLRMPGYIDYEESFKVTGSRHIHGALHAERRGFLDINVVGAGQIYVDGKLVAPGSPANHIQVPADQEVLVSTFDPATKSGDEIRVLVAEGKSRKITLIPRPNYRPGAGR